MIFFNVNGVIAAAFSGGISVAHFIIDNEDFIINYLPLTLDPDFNFPFGIFFYSTFFTSVWLWLYVIAAIILKGLKYFGVIVEKAGTIFDLENKPISALGIVASIFVTFIFAGLRNEY